MAAFEVDHAARQCSFEWAASGAAPAASTGCLTAGVGWPAPSTVPHDCKTRATCSRPMPAADGPQCWATLYTGSKAVCEGTAGGAGKHAPVHVVGAYAVIGWRGRPVGTSRHS